MGPMTDQVISDDETGRKGSCATCRFGLGNWSFQKRGFVSVLCRRYPEHLTRTLDHWCGEYQPSEQSARG